MIRKYLRPKEIEELYGIKTSTLARQRWGKYGPSGSNSLQGSAFRGLVLYNVEEVEKYLNRNTN